jgi:hypothetical protein
MSSLGSQAGVDVTNRRYVGARLFPVAIPSFDGKHQVNICSA